MKNFWFIYKFYYHVLRCAISQFFRRQKNSRDEEFVKKEYEQEYNKSNEDFIYRMPPTLVSGKFKPFHVIDYKKIMIQKFSDIVGKYDLKSILELGSGRGFNILALAVMNPSLKKLRGIELTSGGVATARKNLNNPPIEILSYLTGQSEKAIRERLKNTDIDFIQGSILNLPFEDAFFEGVFSNSVIEQIPRDYLDVFKEASRVCCKAAFFSEPFFEAQRYNIFKLLHLKNIDYFKASYLEVEKAGFKIEKFEIPPLQKFVFNTGLLICAKNKTA